MIRKLIRRLRGCPLCHGDRRVLRFTGEPYAELRACSWCDDGRYLAATTVPAVQLTTG